MSLAAATIFSKGGVGRRCLRRETCITIYIDDQIVDAFKAESAPTGIGYQTLINEALGQHLGTVEKPITAERVSKIVRDELAQVR